MLCVLAGLLAVAAVIQAIDRAVAVEIQLAVAGLIAAGALAYARKTDSDLAYAIVALIVIGTLQWYYVVP